jgi:signal transduction histidine kinase/DNA-binding response OmpR family regulator/CHASE3 domain sensor protein/putative methionine-R-sulfoxide reductase with GAF domain
MHSSFKRNLFIGYAISMLLLIVSSVASYKSIQNLLSSQKAVAHTDLVILKLENILSILKDAETGQRGFLLTNDEQFLEPYNGALDKADRTVDEVKKLTSENLIQQESIEKLRDVLRKRISILQALIDNKKRGIQPTYEQMLSGKSFMDEAKRIVNSMENREQVALVSRTADLNKFTSLTPVLIIIASVLAFLVTLISFIRVSGDFEKRVKLQEELEEKDKDISTRLAIIRNIAEKISSGDYKTRVNEQGKDTLGSLAGSLNKMAESLDHSFENLTNNEWLQKGIAGLNEKMIGEKNIDTLTHNVLDFIASYINAPIGAFYLVFNEKELFLSAGIALNQKAIKKVISFGEGIAGECAASCKQVLIKDVAETDIQIEYSAGSIKPKSILAMPVSYAGKLKGVIEVGFVDDCKPTILEYLKNVAPNIGMSIRTVLDHQRLQELLEETQSQTEELQSQHTELENINTELEMQAEKLQASEEELKVQQEELQQANQELEERSRLLEEKNELIMERNLEVQAKARELETTTKYKSEFLANMSHELRTPLNSILLLSRLLAENKNNNLSSDQVEYANVIQNSGKGLLTLINEILDLSKIEAGKMELEFTEFNIRGLVSELYFLFQPIAKDKDISFNIQVQNDVVQKIETDRLRLEQIMRNLISNALKFTKHGSVTVDITSTDYTISFAVKDTGIGIAKEKHQTIFEAFQQADGSTRRQFGGTGLGLSISRQLAKFLGGEIILNSEEGKGSEFILTIPLNKNIVYKPVEEQIEVPAYTEPPVENKPDEFISDVIPASIPDDRNNISADDKVILIIEDDTVFAKLLVKFTRKNNYKAIVAVRGDEGVQFAEKFHPVGILLDIQLPVKNGWEVMKELKSNAFTRHIPVHIMSAIDAKNKSLSAGAVDFINKPVELDKMSGIFKKIEDALSRHPQKVFIVEENIKHAKALAYFLETSNITSEIKNSVEDSLQALDNKNVDCVILDTGFQGQELNDTLEKIKAIPELQNIPLIVFTGRNLSHSEEMQMKQYADSIVIKTAHSYQRILDEVSLFLHIVEEGRKEKKVLTYKKMGELSEVLKNKTVLIADDDVRNIYSLTRSLEQYGMNVVSAIDGKDALKQLDAHKVNIVLMDMMMPEMDGYESIKQIRANRKYKRLPVIAITAKAMIGDREKCIKAGASDYITKPVDVDQLTSLLRVWLYEV